MADESASHLDPPRPAQFSLRSILLLTAAVAGACALGSWLGSRWLPLLLGMTLYLANYLGMLSFLQGRRMAQAALYLAAGAWAVSLFLPLKEMDFLGWEMVWYCVKSWPTVLTGDDPIAPIALHPLRKLLVRAMYLTVLGLTNLVNLALLLSPLFAHRLVNGKSRWLQSVLMVSIPVVGIWFLAIALHADTEIIPAYYVWCGAMTVPIIVLRISWWELIGAAAMALWLAGAWMAWEFLKQ